MDKIESSTFCYARDINARMNRQIRDSYFARRQCEILHLSRVIDTRLLSRSSFLSHHGPHLTSQRYRFRFLLYGKGAVVDMYEADVVNFIWQIERSSSLSDIIDLRDHDQVKRMKDSGTILENVYVPLSWRQIRDENEDQDECARAVDVPCICRQSKRKRKVSDLKGSCISVSYGFLESVCRCEQERVENHSTTSRENLRVF